MQSYSSSLLFRDSMWCNSSIWLFVGPDACFAIDALLKGGKTQKDGRPRKTSCLRNVITEVCPQGALGQHLCAQYTIEGMPFPDITDQEVWTKAALWPGDHVNKNVTYGQQNKAFNKYLREDLKIMVRKVVHICRILGSRILDDESIPQEVSLNNTYLHAWLPATPRLYLLSTLQHS